MDPFTAGLIGIAGAVIGYGARVLEQWLRAGWEAGHARTAREEVRQDRLDEIQRANLLDLQQRFNEWLRAIVKIHLADRKTLIDRGKLYQLPDDVSLEEFETGRRAMYLIERVRDDELRSKLRAFRSDAAANEVSHLANRADLTAERLDAEWAKFTEFAADVQDDIGRVLRRLL